MNRDHRFYSGLYASAHATPHVRYALEALLFVMGTAEIRAKEDRQLFYEQERSLWSTNLNTTLKALEEWDAASDDMSAQAGSRPHRYGSERGAGKQEGSSTAGV